MLRYISRLAGSRTCRTALLVSALVTGLVAGMLSGVPTASPVALAVTCGVPFSCLGDGTASASVTIGHQYEDPLTHTVYDVEPATTDTVDVTARWYSDQLGGPYCHCQQLTTAQATVTVS